MEIKELLKIGVDKLGERQYLNPILDALLILCYLLDVDKSYLYTHGDRIVSEEVVDKFLYYIDKRKTGYPLSYLLNEKDFYDLSFYVEEGVLVPRPDTEILVDWVINTAIEKYQGKPINILDLGTGSGCIALTLAYHLKNALVYAIDLDDVALKITEKNINKHNLKDRVVLCKGDMFCGIKPLQLGGKIDIIVSNPPYIPTKDIDELQVEVKNYEPRRALDGGIDGLDFYNKIIPESKDYLRKGGILAFEIGYDQGESVKDIFIKEGFKDVKVIKDLQDLDRVVVGILA